MTRVALVTGGGRGIGRAIALGLGGPGTLVAVAGRTVRDLDAVAAELTARGGRALALEMDVTSDASVAAGFEAVEATGRRLDVLVNNAGMGGGEPIAGSDIARWRRTVDTNLTGTYLVSRAAVPLMREGGRIINLSSVLGRFGVSGYTAYCAAKHGVIGLTRSLALEAARTAVTVNAVCPGYTETDIVKNTVANIMAKTGKSEAEARAALTSHNPQGRTVLPEEVANAVLWLCLPGSEAITGQPISVAGGEVM